MKCLEAHHRLGDPFDEAVILLKDVVEIFNLPNFNYMTSSCEFQDRVHSL